MPSNAKLLPFRSNVPYLAGFCLSTVDEGFAARAREMGESIIVGGDNYGQGSSREHAALAPLQLGVRAVIVKSFARMHRDNLINSGILPLTFDNAADYDGIAQGDTLEFDAISAVDSGRVVVKNKTKNTEFVALLPLTDRQKNILRFGGTINMIKNSK